MWKDGSPHSQTRHSNHDRIPAWHICITEAGLVLKETQGSRQPLQLVNKCSDITLGTPLKCLFPWRPRPPPPPLSPPWDYLMEVTASSHPGHSLSSLKKWTTCPTVRSIQQLNPVSEDVCKGRGILTQYWERKLKCSHTHRHTCTSTPRRGDYSWYLVRLQGNAKFMIANFLLKTQIVYCQEKQSTGPFCLWDNVMGVKERIKEKKMPLETCGWKTRVGGCKWEFGKKIALNHLCPVWKPSTPTVIRIN